MTDSRWCAFAVGHLECALPAGDIEEVVRRAAVTPVPLAEPAVRGLAQIRGRVMPVIDLRRCLGLPDREPGAEPMHVIARTGDGPLGLEVDRIFEVIDAGAAELLPPPDSLPPEVRGLIAGTWVGPQRLILLIELGQVIARTAGAAVPLRAPVTA